MHPKLFPLIIGLFMFIPLATFAQTDNRHLQQQLAVLQEQLVILRNLILSLSLPSQIVSLQTSKIAASQYTNPPILKITTDYSQIEDTVSAGNVWLPFVKYILDARGSGEAISIPSLTAILTSTATTSLINCRVSDETNYITTRDQAFNETTAARIYTFALDKPVEVLPDTIRTLLLSCDVIEAAIPADLFRWGLDASKFEPVTGVSSGKKLMPTMLSERGAAIVVAQ